MGFMRRCHWQHVEPRTIADEDKKGGWIWSGSIFSPFLCWRWRPTSPAEETQLTQSIDFTFFYILLVDVMVFSWNNVDVVDGGWVGYALCLSSLLLIATRFKFSCEGERMTCGFWEKWKGHCLLGLLWDGSQLLLIVEEAELIWWRRVAFYGGWGFDVLWYIAAKGGVREERWLPWEIVGGKGKRVVCLGGAAIAIVVASCRAVVEEILLNMGFNV